MRDWLDYGNHSALLAAIDRTMVEDVGISKEWRTKRSENIFDYTELVSSLLRNIGKTTLKKCGNNRTVYKREKNNEVSVNFREKGNNVFVSSQDQKHLEKAFELYTKSIAHAVSNTQAMGMAYANRSAVLLKLNRPKESLEDVERAFNSNYPKKLRAKLFVRKAECYATLAMHSYIQSKHWLSRVLADDPGRKEMERQLREYSAKDYEQTIDKELIMPKIESPSTKYPCASDAIEVEYSGYAGKKIIATRDIEIGEVLVVEKPYTVCLDKNNYYYYCHFCLESFWAGIPCDQCTHTLYCSPECKAAAWEKYHKFECPVSDLLQQHDEPPAVLIITSLKLFIEFCH